MNDWRTVYLCNQNESIQFQPEMCKGNLVNGLPGISKRFSYKDFKSVVTKKVAITF